MYFEIDSFAKNWSWKKLLLYVISMYNYPGKSM